METVKAKVIAEFEDLESWLDSIESVNCADLGCVYDLTDGIIDEVKASAIITTQHAQSLAALVEYFKGMIETGNIPEQRGRSDELTAAYCDELLEDLKQ
jgi:hypothetical protein